MAGHIIYTHSTIPAPREAVWDVITDVNHAERVLRSVSDTEQVSDGSYAVGTTWRERRNVFGHHGVEDMQVVECVAPAKAVVEAGAGSDTIRTSYRLTPDSTNTNTRLAMTTTIEMSHRSAVSRAVWRVFGNLSFQHTRRVLEHDLEDIETEAVRRSVTA